MNLTRIITQELADEIAMFLEEPFFVSSSHHLNISGSTIHSVKVANHARTLHIVISLGEDVSYYRCGTIKCRVHEVKYHYEYEKPGWVDEVLDRIREDIHRGGTARASCPGTCY